MFMSEMISGQIDIKTTAQLSRILTTYRHNVKHCSTFLIYNDVHYHIPSMAIFQNGKVNKLKWPMHSSRDRFREHRYMIEREDEEDR